MSLEQAIIELTVELKRYNDAAGTVVQNVIPLKESPKETPPVKETKPTKEAEPEPTKEAEPEPTKEAEPTVEKTGVTEDDLKALGMKLMKGKKMKEYTAIVKKYGASKVSDLDPAAYDKCYADLTAEVNKI